MDPKIEPDCWDSIVVGSGLFECLLASALAKLGQSVLILDQEDTYGQEYASITLDSLRQIAAGFPASLTAEADTNGPDAHAHNADMSTQAAELCGEDQAQGRSVPKGSERLTIVLPGFKPPLHNFTHVTSSSFTQLPSKLFILDLMPKIMFQGEAMTEVLVKARAHHYLEFKRVEGSFMVTTAPQSVASATPPSTVVKVPDSNRQLTYYMFRPVPASKSDIFKDRSLGLSEKRSLMTFLAAAVEAGQGAGRLKDALNSSSGSLVDVLISEGLSEELQQVLMYGIAMCDFSQESTPCPLSVSFSTGIDHYKSSSPTPPPSNLTHPTSEGDQLHAHVKSHEALGTTAHKMTACEGLQALQLMAESIARFSSPGAFMLPSWGCGSLPEAFVRCCAVNGGTTVLKCRVTAAVLRKGHGPTPPTQSINTEEGCGDAIAALELSDAACPEGHVQRQIIREDTGVSEDSNVDRWHVESICTAGGQVLRCKHLVTSPSVLNALNKALARADPEVRSTCSIPPLSQHPASSVHRALVIMEGSLVHGQNAITFVIPPHSQLLGGGNRHPIRGLQLGPSLSVSPANRYLLYLSCPAIGSLPVDQSTHLTAFQVLHPAVHLLTQPAVQEVGPGQVNSENDQGSGNSVTDKRPRAVEVFYYSQTSEVVSGPSGPLANVVANESSLSPLGLVGYSSVLEAAEAAFRKYFPDQEWLSDIDLEKVKGLEDVEEDAVEDLEAALGQLQALQDVEKT